jgi:hypothetical protein
MRSSKPLHPVRRIRDALKATPKEFGLREYATSAGFAKLLGRSSSLIRNVECGVTKKWDSVADLIQRKTRVSRKWLLSEPKPEDPILDVSGRPWNPGRELDPLRPRRDMPDWRMFVENCPGVLPDLVAEIVKAQLTLELSLGRTEFLEVLISSMARSCSFENPALKRYTDHNVRTVYEEGAARKMWRRSQSHDYFDVVVERLQKEGTASLTLDGMNEILKDGDFGWAAKLRESATEGVIKLAREFYQSQAPKDSGRHGGDDNAEKE